MDDYAKVDSNLAKSQRAIGESSNLAQVAQTYACNFSDQKFIDYVCILSVLAQVAIDSAKRRFDIDLTDEIRRIKQDMDISVHGYPSFWRLIRRDTNPDKINPSLICPMNYLYNLELPKYRDENPTIPISYFFKKNELISDKRSCKKVEELISQYSLKLSNHIDGEEENYLLLRSDFDDLISDINKVNISKNYAGLMSWLIDRAFVITNNVQYNHTRLRTKLNKNKALLLKVLYTINKKTFFTCFNPR